MSAATGSAFLIFGPQRHEICRLTRDGVSSFLTMTCKPQKCRKSTVTFVLRMPRRSGL